MEVKEPSAKYLARPRYKQTEVGLIPEDWDVVSASDACSKVQDGTHFSPRIRGDDYLYVTSKNIRFGYLDMSTANRIDTAQHQAIYRRCDVKKGDLLLTKDGANTGNAALNTLDEEFSLLSSVAFLRFHQSKHCAAYFLQQILTSRGQRQIQDAMAGNAITRLTLEKINKLFFPAPPTKAEQEAIAEALSDADAFIESLERLLAKKRQLKQGAMQELLTGKKRLPGFGREHGHKQRTGRVLPAEWDAGPIGRAIERLEAGASVNSDRDEAPEFESYPCVLKTGAASGGSFDPRESKKVAERDLWRLKVSVRKDTILISRMNTVELVGESGHVLCDYPNLFVPDRMWMATVRSRVSPRWLSYILAWQPVRSQISASATGTSGSMKNISKPSFRAVEIPYPPIEEQRAIATVLSDMDAEIAALAARITKDRQVKQGMMQELLTGRVRLI